MEKDWKIHEAGDYEIFYIDFLNNYSKEKREQNTQEDKPQESSSPKSRYKMKITSIDSRKRGRIIGIILAKDDDIVGAAEVHVLEDNNAEISMLHFWKTKIELPEKLKSQGHKFNRGEAIFVEEGYKGKGYGTDLIKIILAYLETIGVKKLEVHGITQHGVVEFYKKTGAKILSLTSAEYDVEKALAMLRERKTQIEI